LCARTIPLEDVRIEAKRLVADHPDPFGKRLPLIYGDTVEGRSALVTSN
jgi:hypothetical protein